MSIAIPTLLALASVWAPPGEAPQIQRPGEVAPAPATPEAEPVAEAAPTEPAVEATAEVAPSEPVAEPEPEPEPEPVEEAVTTEAETAAAEGDDSGTLRVATERSGPPYYTEADLEKLRARHGLEPESPPAPEGARWRCLIADPTCRHSVELQAMGAYALRARQGDVSEGNVDRWNSARAQYDVWVSLPALFEDVGKTRFTRMSMGPKGGVVFSDGGDLWGNVGLAMRYWLGRGRWAPNIEVTSALSFKLATRVGNDVEAERFRLQRGPVGFSADVGFGLGGFGAIVLGGQYDSPLAREEVPEEFRVVSSGMFYVGFRGNILWGGPAAAAVGAHAATRAAERP
ncbi:MAG: hypothetical protein AAF799_12180 [Myxococcota bacterium]